MEKTSPCIQASNSSYNWSFQADNEGGDTKIGLHKTTNIQINMINKCKPIKYDVFPNRYLVTHCNDSGGLTLKVTQILTTNSTLKSASGYKTG